jgi:hypothetical protein
VPLGQGARKAAEAAGREADSRLLVVLAASNLLSLGLGVAVGYWLYRSSPALTQRETGKLSTYRRKTLLSPEFVLLR